MKVFVINKNAEDNLNLFRCSDNKENLQRIVFNKNSKINYITINNPSKSRQIYTLNHIYFKSKHKNKLYVLIGENTNNALKKPSAFPMPVYEIKNEYTKNYIEVFSVDTLSDEYIDILENKYLIMAPGGSVSIKLENSADDLSLEIDVVIEDF